MSGFSVRVCLVNPGNVRTMERQEIPDIREQPRNLISGLVVIGDGFTERQNSNAGFVRTCQFVWLPQFGPRIGNKCTVSLSSVDTGTIAHLCRSPIIKEKDHLAGLTTK